ncbi:hypothetical protein [Amycolatopsis taiwanensis]|uniref:Uncharacterized protein n=1 Tax=Amycolatopsis taiwanensis TaxID=342230 RepID=A0A9W6VEI6_9PSEU|nr:hypothetical protein [Amycolatopsis taiwanensis]GLY65810.1 hypothetical protein Atai01_24290 [Amycolatopsis taiwanensis]
MDRFDRVGRGAAYGAAVAMAPYLLIKVFWVAGVLLGLIPPQGMGVTQWVLLNTVTVGMAVIGILLALALVRPWGMRLPAAPLLFCGWIASGFLVSMLPYAALDSLTDPSDGTQVEQGASAPGWEAVFIQVSFVGMGLGLAVALPAYLRRRWPRTLTGRIGDRVAVDERQDGLARASAWLLAAGAVLSACWLYWAAGGTAGLASPAEPDTDGRLLMAVSAVWALVGSAGAWTTANRRPARLPRWLPTVALWLGSGSLFAWNAWRLPFTAYAAFVGPVADSAMPQNLGVAAAIQVIALVTGAAMLRVLVRTYATTIASPVAHPA